MKTLTLQVPDEVYAACEKIAHRTGRTVEECVLEFLLRHRPRPAAPPNETQEDALNRLRQHFGVQSLGRPTGAENESIDADSQQVYLKELLGDEECS